MNTLSPETLTQVVLWLAVLAGLTVVGAWVVQRFRGGAAGTGGREADLLAKFQEMHREGDINEAEYRTIKSVLGEQIQRNVKRAKDKP
jgi:hypothetical protein